MFICAHFFLNVISRFMASLSKELVDDNFTVCKLISSIAHFKNVRGLGKSMVVFRLFEKLRYSHERSTKFVSLKQE